MNPLVTGIAAYIVLQFGIGLWVSRRIRTEDDFLVAGRSLGPGVTTFTVFATWFGAETCVSAAGLAPPSFAGVILRLETLSRPRARLFLPGCAPSSWEAWCRSWWRTRTHRPC